MLGDADLPDDVEEAVTAATMFYHTDGGSGPLGGAYLGVLLAALGYRPKRMVEKPPERVDFRRLPSDGSVNVEVCFGDDWKPGTFLGMIDTSLCVKLDDEEFHREFSPLETRLAPENNTQKKTTKRSRAAEKSVATA